MKPVSDPSVLSALNSAPPIGAAATPQAVRDPSTLAQLDYGIDLSAPDEDVRKKIASLPETEKSKAHDVWADYRVTKLRNAGFDQHPDAAVGIPLIGGFLDEATAGVQGGLNVVSGGRVGMPYDEALAFERARQRQATAADPAEATIGQLGAGLVAGGPIFSRITPAATLAGRVVQGAAVGGGVGAVEGFARGEGGFADRAENAGNSAEGGAILGLALPVAGAGATRAIGKTADLINPTLTRLRAGPDEAADEILARRIAQEGSTPAQKRLDLQKGQAVDSRLNTNSNATLPETLADTSDAMQRLTGSLYRTGGEAGNFVKQELQTRQRGPENPFAPQEANAAPSGQQARVMDATERALLVRSADTARRTDTQIMAQQARDGRRLYQEARDSSEPFNLQPVVDGVALKAQEYPPPFAQKLQQAVDLFTRPVKAGGAAREDAMVQNIQRMMEDQDLKAARMAPGPKLDQLHEDYSVKIRRALEDLDTVRAQNRIYAAQRAPVDNVARVDAGKKALDDMIDQAQRAGEGNLVRELSDVKDQVLNAVHRPDKAGNPTINKTYAQARQTWGSAAENRNAIELGRSALRDGSEIGVENFRDLSQGQQQLFRLGFMESLRNRIASNKPGNDITQLFQQNRVQELMGEIIPRSRGSNAVFANRPERFGNLLNREQRMVQTRNAVLGNSATAQRIQDDMGFAGDALAGMWNRFRQSPTLSNMAFEAIGTGIQKIFGYRQDVALALARRLLEQDPTVRNQILRRLQSRGGPGRLQQLADHIDRSSIALTSSSAPALSAPSDDNR